MVVLGVSTGGPAAISKVLEQLPADFPLGIAMVQDIESGFGEGYARWLNPICKLNVRIAENNDLVSAGEVVVAPDNKHMRFKDCRLILDDRKEVLNQKPSVNVLFQSAAKNFGKRLIGVLLTGMGTDRAEGCWDIVANGGYTIVQDEATSTVFGMPKAAIEAGGASTVLPIQEIGQTLIKITSKR